MDPSNMPTKRGRPKGRVERKTKNQQATPKRKPGRPKSRVENEPKRLKREYSNEIIEKPSFENERKRMERNYPNGIIDKPAFRPLRFLNMRGSDIETDDEIPEDERVEAYTTDHETDDEIVEEGVIEDCPTDYETDDETLENDSTEDTEEDKKEYIFVPDYDFLVSEVIALRMFLKLTMDGGTKPRIFITRKTIDMINAAYRELREKGIFGQATAVVCTIQMKRELFCIQTRQQVKEWSATDHLSEVHHKIVKTCMDLKNWKNWRNDTARIFLLTKDVRTLREARFYDVGAYDFQGLMKAVKFDDKFEYASWQDCDVTRPDFFELSTTEKKRYDRIELYGSRFNIKEVIEKGIRKAFRIFEITIDYVIITTYNKKRVRYTGNNTMCLITNLEEILRNKRPFTKYFDNEDMENLKCMLEELNAHDPFESGKIESIRFISIIEELLTQIEGHVPKLNLAPKIEYIKMTRRGLAGKFNHLDFCIRTIDRNEDIDIYRFIYYIISSFSHLCGCIMKHYEIEHNFFFYFAKPQLVPDEIELVQSILYPAVIFLRNLLKDLERDLDEQQDVEYRASILLTELRKLLPKFYLPDYDPLFYCYVTPRSVTKWLEKPSSRIHFRNLRRQIARYYVKLAEAEDHRRFPRPKPSEVTRCEREGCCHRK